MRLRWGIFAAILATLAPACVVQASRSRTRNAPYDLTAMARETFRQINRRRRDQGLPNLAWDEALAAVARRHSDRMAENHYFSHVDPETGDLEARLNRAGIPWTRCEENIFEENGYSDPVARAVQSWMNSPAHRRNLLSREVTRTGVGVAVASDGTFYFTQDFTRP